MRITTDTRYFTVAPVLRALTDEQLEELRERAPKVVLGDGGYNGITLGQLAVLTTRGAKGVFTKAENEQDVSVFEYYCAEGFAAWFEDYTKKLQRLQPPMTSEEKAAQAACMQVGMIEGLLIFAREYFGLHSFGEAEQVTLGDLLIAKKDAYNKAVYQREYNRIITKPTRKK